MKSAGKICLAIILAFGLSYAGLIFCIPIALNSEFMVKKYENILSSKLDLNVRLTDFKFLISPALSIKLSVGNITAKNNVHKSVINIKDLSLISDSFSIIPKTIDIDKIYIDCSSLNRSIEFPKSSSKNILHLDFSPVINTNRIYVKLDEKGSYLDIKSIRSAKDRDAVVYKMIGALRMSYMHFPIEFGNSGSIYYKNDFYFDKFLIVVAKAPCYISGGVNELSFRGYNLPVKDLEGTFLYFYKQKYPNKKNFIENFQNFSGTLDVNLTLSKSGLNGKCIAKNLGADFSKFKIPVFLPKTVFIFKDRSISAKTSGLFGGEPVYTDFYLSNLATDQLKVTGNVSSMLTNDFAKKYFNYISIVGSLAASVKYYVQNSVVNIDYRLKIPKGSNLLSDYGDLDNISVDRLISAHTIKNGDNIKMNSYKYEFILPDEGRSVLLLNGDGLFSKVSGHYKPVYLSIKTNEPVNLSLIKSFIRNTLQGGVFAADLKYDFLQKKLYGFLRVYKSSFKQNLYLDEVSLLLSDKFVKIDGVGKFYNSPIKLVFCANNDFDNIIIHNINIVLDQFNIRPGKMPVSYSSQIRKNVKVDKNITVEKGRIHIKKIMHSKFTLSNVEMLANMHNNIVHFTIPQTQYANGILHAAGIYNISDYSSDIRFLASGIDSNIVASSLFNLHDQIEGCASATLHLITKNKLNDIKAYATFAVQDGFLPKLGSKEFIVSGSKTHKVLFFLKKPFKFTLSKISNIDFSNQDTLSSDLRGSFEIDNNNIKNVRLFSKSEFLSLFIEGNYNIVSEKGKLFIWGRHNKIEEKKIKIFKIPLSFLYKVVFKQEKSKHIYQDKLKEIPPIHAKPEEEALFRVFVDGNINTNDVKVILKDLK